MMGACEDELAAGANHEPTRWPLRASRARAENYTKKWFFVSFDAISSVAA